MKRTFLKIALFTLVVSIASCKSTSETNNDRDTSSRPERSQGNDRQQGGGQQGERGQRPTTDQIFAQMDTNKDNKLAKSEVKGPIKNDFSSIDTNNDGFISKEELENAPKPEGRGQQGGGQRR